MSRSPERYDLFRARLQRFTRLLQDVQAGDVRAVHRTRVASRRLREVVPVLQLEADVAGKLAKRLRRVTDQLGAVRELDVMARVIEELAGTGRYPAAALERVAAAVAEHRRGARSRLLTKGFMRELGRVEAKLRKVARSLDRSRSRAAKERACRWAIEARVARRASALAKAISRAGTVYLPERLHDVRIAVKKLRYAQELSTDLARLKSTPELRQLRRTQTVLGRLHDLQVLIDRTRAEQAALAPPDINVWRALDGLVAMLEDDCRRLHARYIRDAAALSGLCMRLAAPEVKTPKVGGRRI